MSRLLRVELRRLSARRLVRWSAAATLALAVLTVVLAFVSSLPPSEAERADARAMYDQGLADWEENGEEWVEQCEQDEELARETEPEADFACDQMQPRLEHYLSSTPTFEGDATSWPMPGATTVEQIAPLLVLVAVVVGISFLTAEISTGSIGLWLTFEPRRRRVYWSKALAVSIGVLPIVAVAYVVMAAGAYGAFALNGQLGDVTTSTWTELAAAGARVLAASALVAAVGAALGTLTRNAAAALGLVVVWALVVENVLRGVVPELQRWFVGTNLLAWAQGGTTYWVQECTTDVSGTMCMGVERTVSQTQGGLVLVALAAVLSLLAAAVFRRRDVS